MPVIVRNYTDDEATIIMVDSNIQREDILPSEKAKAYAMKYEAMKHQGSRGGSTLDEVGEAAGESGKTVQRYVWLARLSDELLGMVDAKKIGIVQGVDIFSSSSHPFFIDSDIRSSISPYRSLASLLSPLKRSSFISRREVKETDFKREKNLTSGSKETGLQEVKGFAPNYNNTNYNDQNHTDMSYPNLYAGRLRAS